VPLIRAFSEKWEKVSFLEGENHRRGKKKKVMPILKYVIIPSAARRRPQATACAGRRVEVTRGASHHDPLLKGRRGKERCTEKGA